MNKKILRLAIPNIITNITIPLLGMIDMAIVGHLSRAHIGGITIGTAIFNLLYWNFGFLRMGTSGLTAQAYGARQSQEAVNILVRALTIAIGLAILLIVFQIPIAYGLLHFIGGEKDTQNLALIYFSIRIWAAPANLSLYAIKGWFIGMQNSRTPMWIAIFINIVNILFSLWFVFVLHYDMAGVAWGTVIAQYAGLLLALFFLRFHYHPILRSHWQFGKSMQWNAMKQFFLLNGDIFLRTLCLSIVFTFITAASAHINDDILAINALLLQFFTLFSYIMDGFAYAGEALVGRYIGAQNRIALLKTIRGLFRWGIILSAFFMFLYAFFGTFILSLFTNDTLLISAAGDYLWCIVVMPVTAFAAFLWDGIYVGATASKAMRNAMFVASVVFFAIYYAAQFLMKHGMVPSTVMTQNICLWIAFLVYLSLRALMQWLLAEKNVYPKPVS